MSLQQGADSLRRRELLNNVNAELSNFAKLYGTPGQGLRATWTARERLRRLETMTRRLRGIVALGEAEPVERELLAIVAFTFGWCEDIEAHESKRLDWPDE